MNFNNAPGMIGQGMMVQQMNMGGGEQNMYAPTMQYQPYQPQQNYNQGGNTMNNNNMASQLQLPNGNKEVKEEEDELSLEIAVKEFDGLLKTKITTITELGKMVNKIFRTTISDCEGCLITPNNKGGFDTVLYFKPSTIVDETKLKALEEVGTVQPNSTMAQRFQNFTVRQKNKKFNLSSEVKGILKEFMITDRNGKINWNQCITEKSSGYYGSYSVYVQVSGLDIIKILKKRYGDQAYDLTPEGNKINFRRMDYEMKVIRGLGMMDNNTGICADYLVSILQLDSGEMEKVAKQAGVVPMTAELPMIREF